jgi:hypothetical protein
VTSHARQLQQVYDVYLILGVNISNQLIPTYQNAVDNSLSTYDKGLIAGIVCLFGIVFLIFFVKKKLTKKKETKRIFQMTPLHFVPKEQREEKEDKEGMESLHRKEVLAFRNAFKPSRIRK